MKTYFKNVLVSIDQLGNTICGGEPDNTISARVGYFASKNRGPSKYYWKLLEKIIDTTFWPIDGPNHCLKAFENDPEETFHDKNGDVFRVLLSFIIIITCVPISILLYFLWAVKFLSPKTKLTDSIKS